MTDNSVTELIYDERKTNIRTMEVSMLLQKHTDEQLVHNGLAKDLFLFRFEWIETGV